MDENKIENVEDIEVTDLVETFDDESGSGKVVLLTIAGAAAITGLFVGARKLWKRHKAKKKEADEDLFEDDLDGEEPDDFDEESNEKKTEKKK